MSENAKIKTYTLGQEGGCDLIDTGIDNIVEALRNELESTELTDDDEVIEFTVRIEKKHTQTELENLGDWDGF